MEVNKHHRSLVAIRSAASMLNIKIDTIWSKHNIDILYKYYPIEGCACTKRLIGIKNRQQIKSKAAKLGIKYQPKIWTVPQEEQLIKLFSVLGPNTKIDGKSKAQILLKAKTLGLTYTHPALWTIEQDNYLKLNYPKYGEKCFTNIINKTRNQCMTRVQTLKIKGPGRKRKIKVVETNKVYLTIKEAALDNAVTSGTIIQALKNSNKTAGGYHWEYINEEDN